MKRFLALVLIAVLLIGVVPLTAASAAQYATVVGGWLRLRETASFYGNTITSYYTGTVVEILGTSGGWYKVKAPDGKVGYMYGSYLNVGGGAPVDGGTTGVGSATVTSTNGYGVRLRTGPGTGYRIIRTYAVGTRATVLQRGSYWSQINISGTVGYMMNQFLNFGGSSETPGTTTDANATIWSRNGYGVRLRTGPGKGYGIIGVYSVGTQVRVITYDKTWCYIQVGSRTGYMMTEFLDVKQTTNEVTAVSITNKQPVVDDILSVKSITPSGAKVDYSWIVNGDVKGIDKDFVVDASYVGSPILLKVTGKSGFTGYAIATTEDVRAAHEQINTVTLNNTSPTKGDTLSIAAIDPEDATYTCKWYVDGAPAGTGTTYKVTSKQATDGATIYVEVTGTGVYATGTSVQSDTATAIDAASATLNSVSVTNVTTGTPDCTDANVGQVLRADPDPDTAQVSYQWYYINADGDEKKYTGKTSRQITVDKSVKDLSIFVRVAGKSGTPYAGQSEDSPQIDITGNKRLTGVTLAPLTGLKYDDEKPTKLTATVKASATIPSTVTVNYEWKWADDGTVVQTGADKTYTVEATDVGHKISVTASISDSEWTDEAFTATSTDMVSAKLKGVALYVNDSPSAKCYLGDTVSVRVTPAGVPDENLLVTWMVNGIQRDVAPTHTIDAADVSKTKVGKLKAIVNALAPYTGSFSVSLNIQPDASGSLSAAEEAALAASGAEDGDVQTLVASTEGDTPPAEGSEPIAEGDTPPAEGSDPPAEGGEPPAEGGEPPAEGGEPPAEGGEPPAEGGEPPVEGGEPPAEGGEPPAEGGETPIDDQIVLDDGMRNNDPIIEEPVIDEQPPVNEQPPAVPQQPEYHVELVQRGSTLEARLNIASENATYRWFVGETELSGAISSTYRLSEADYGQSVKVVVSVDGQSAQASITPKPPVEDELVTDGGLDMPGLEIYDPSQNMDANGFENMLP